MISIIIPTLNEEKYLPLLFESIKNQKFKDYEIIVADANSKDKTAKIARDNNCRVVLGGLPAKARNEGSKVANGNLLLFLDADIVLNKDFLVNALEDFKKQNLDVATFPLFLDGGLASRIVSRLYNFWVIVTQPFFPHAFGAALLVKKDVYENIGGFDETITLAEDHDFARRANKIAKCGIIKSAHASVSTRRFRKDGWVKMIIKYVLCELYTIFCGPIRTDIFKYEFDHYDE